MSFKEFATNYLNPIFLMYRAVLLTISGWMIFFSIPLFISSTGRFEVLVILAVTFTITVTLILKIKNSPYVLYLGIPIVLMAISLSLRGTQPPESGVLFVPLILWLISSLLITWNGVRSWGYGISMNDINKKLDNYN